MTASVVLVLIILGLVAVVLLMSLVFVVVSFAQGLANLHGQAGESFSFLPDSAAGWDHGTFGEDVQ